MLNTKMSNKLLYTLKNTKIAQRFILTTAALILALSWLTPLLPNKASAAGQLTSRNVSISTAVPGQTGVTYTFNWKNVSTTPIKGIKFVACDSAVGTYGLDATSTCASGSAAAGMSFSSGPAAWVSQTGFADNANAFARDGTGSTYCTPAANVLCASRATATTSETTNTSHQIVFNGIKNPTSTNYTFYIGIYTYALTSNSTALDSGTAASAVVQTLTINAAVAEVLNFCVGATTTNDATTSPAADCSAVSGTSVNIGTLDTSSINVSPVSTNGGNNSNGIAMMRTNAINGATVSYDAIQQAGTNHQGTLRVSSASCNAGNVSTDQCIDAQGGTQGTFTAGTEKFGMTIAGTNCGSVTPANYSCTYTSATEHLVPSSNYVGAGTTGTPSTYTFGTTNGFAWVETGTATQIASSTTVVDDEALILKFAATPSITTPFGAYAAQADFIAVATY